MYVISNGHNYIMKRKGGRICATCDINLALQFESKGLAICEINKLPAGYKKWTLRAKVYGRGHHCWQESEYNGSGCKKYIRISDGRFRMACKTQKGFGHYG